MLRLDNFWSLRVVVLMAVVMAVVNVTSAFAGAFETNVAASPIQEMTDDDAAPAILPFEGEMRVANKATTAGKATKYYDQPQFEPTDGHDAVEFFIVSGDNYTGRAYFVVSLNASSGNWMLYNYRQETAEKYFAKTELMNGLYVPTAKAETRQDSSSTSFIDESKIPLMTEESYNAMFCNWRSFSDIPFMKAVDGTLVYATYEVDDDGSGQQPGGENPSGNQPGGETPSGNQPGKGGWSDNYYRYTVSLNVGAKNTYQVFVQKSVSYNGKKHVWSGLSASGKFANDVDVRIYGNGQLIDPSLYTLTFKNNVKANGYGWRKLPQFVVKFKFKNESLKPDIKAFRKKTFCFDIQPLDLYTGKVSLDFNKSGTIKKVTFTAADGAVYKLSKKDYCLRQEVGGRMTMTGIGNFIGTVNVKAGDNGSGGGNGGFY